MEVSKRDAIAIINKAERLLNKIPEVDFLTSIFDVCADELMANDNEKSANLLGHIHKRLCKYERDIINVADEVWPIQDGELYKELSKSSSKTVDIIGKLDLLIVWYYGITTHDEAQSAEPRQQSRPIPEAIKRSDATLRAIKIELEKFGLINNGCWVGSPSEYAELVRHLKEDCGVENRGGYAWGYCRLFFGYQGSDKSAQNAITSNVGNITSDAAAVIRRICQNHKSNNKYGDL